MVPWTRFDGAPRHSLQLQASPGITEEDDCDWQKAAASRPRMVDNNMWGALKLPCDGTISIAEVQAAAMHHQSESMETTVHRGCLFERNVTASGRRTRRSLASIAEADPLHHGYPPPRAMHRPARSSPTYPPADLPAPSLRSEIKPSMRSWPSCGRDEPSKVVRVSRALKV